MSAMSIIMQYASSPQGLLCLAAFAWFCAGLAALLVTRRALRRMTMNLARIEQLTNGTCAELTSLVGEEAARLEEVGRERQSALLLLSERLDQLELRAAGQNAYEHAIELARMGLSPDQLMSTVGLTRGEAELLAHLHRAQAA